MTAGERKAAAALALIYSFRMLGLFMIFPVFALYAVDYTGATPALIGLALGIYGLTQALLQIPFGLLSDRFGRKPMIAIGLVLFAIGSAVAALADSMLGVILGRALQGSGAVAAVVMALAADLSREQQRTKMMASIGASIGVSFAVALFLGPLLAQWGRLAGIFWFTALLALMALVVLYVIVPTPVRSRRHRDAQTVPSQLGQVMRNPDLLRLDFGIFVLHMALTGSFVVIPLGLRDTGLAAPEHWQVYLPVLFASILIMIPLIILAEARRRMKPVFVGAIIAVAASELLLAATPQDVWSFAAVMVLFFGAFNVLEASLPSLISKTAPPDSKGSAMGVYSTSQFLGAFVGGAAAGQLSALGGAPAVHIGAALVLVVWAVVALGMRPPAHVSSYMLQVGEVDAQSAIRLSERLSEVAGVQEAVVVAEEGLAYLKVDRRLLDEQALHACLAPR